MVISLEKIARIALLKDIYGSLLTKKQQEVLELFYDQDFSLGEIAEELCVSRQAVFDTLGRGEKLLEHYEVALGLLSRLEQEKRMRELLRQALEKKDWSLVADVIDNLAADES